MVDNQEEIKLQKVRINVIKMILVSFDLFMFLNIPLRRVINFTRLFYFLASGIKLYFTEKFL